MRDQLVLLGNGAHALATQILGNADDAADAVHDVFAKVLGRPQAYDSRKGPVRPWFLRLVRNHCIDLLRRRRPQTQGAEELQAAGPGPEAPVELAQRDQRLMQALAALTEDQRQIIVLRDYLELSYAEVALVLGIATGTVMSRLHRARMALKEELSDDEG